MLWIGNICLTDCHTHIQMNPLNGGLIWLQKTMEKLASGVCYMLMDYDAEAGK